MRGSMVCSSCGASNAATRRFCLECGNPLSVACPDCGATNEPNARFCGGCGVGLATAGAGASTTASGAAGSGAAARTPLAERRVVSVLLADLVGFTPFAEERDAADVRETLTRYFELASEVRADVACVHAYEDAPTTCAFDDCGPALRSQLEELIARHVPGDCPIRVEPVVRRGAPWEKLVNVATELGADLIIVGSDGQRGAAHRGFLGTVANRLAITSPRSVVVVPSRPGLQLNAS